jgi:hypothetical protein
METQKTIEARQAQAPETLIYDPNNLHPLDAEDRRNDDHSEGIDWDEIIATTQADWGAGRYEEFDPAPYATGDAFLNALVASWCR